MVSNSGDKLEGKLMRYLWDNYIELSDATDIIFIGHGSACGALMELVNHRGEEYSWALADRQMWSTKCAPLSRLAVSTPLSGPTQRTSRRGHGSARPAASTFPTSTHCFKRSASTADLAARSSRRQSRQLLLCSTTSSRRSRSLWPPSCQSHPQAVTETASSLTLRPRLRHRHGRTCRGGSSRRPGA